MPPILLVFAFSECKKKESLKEPIPEQNILFTHPQKRGKIEGCEDVLAYVSFYIHFLSVL
jgi:hypothetical protein